MNFSQIKNYKISILFIFTAMVLALYLPFFFHLLDLRELQINRGEGLHTVLPIYGSDSIGYGLLADNLLQNGSLAYGGDYLHKPDTFRTPGFPAVLAVFKAVSGSYKYFPLLQILFVVGTAFLIYKIGRKFTETVGVAAGLLYIFDPTTIFHALNVNSDISFAFFLIFSVYCLFFRDREISYFSVFDGGLLLAVATLIRPISMYLIVPLVLVYTFILKTKSVEKQIILKTVGLFIASFIIILAPWFVRNKLITDTWGLASVQSFNLFHYTIPEFVSFKRNVQPDDLRRELYVKAEREGVDSHDVDKIKNGSVLNSISYPYILSSPIGYAKWHVVKMTPFFFSSGFKNFFYIYNDILGYEVYKTNNENLTNYLMRGQFKKFSGVIGGQILITLEQIFWVIIFILMFIPLFKKDNRIYVLLLFGLILYLALPTVPVAYSRFRIPAAPYMFVLASCGFLLVKDLISVKIKRIKK